MNQDITKEFSEKSGIDIWKLNGLSILTDGKKWYIKHVKTIPIPHALYHFIKSEMKGVYGGLMYLYDIEQANYQNQ